MLEIYGFHVMGLHAGLALKQTNMVRRGREAMLTITKPAHGHFIFLPAHELINYYTRFEAEIVSRVFENQMFLRRAIFPGSCFYLGLDKEDAHSLR